MKKFMALVLALILALNLMACGSASSQQPGDDQNSGDDVVDAVSPAVTDGATLGEGQHSFTLEITDAEGKTITAAVKSDEETVGAALSKLGVIQGSNGLYTTVNGETCDYNVDHTYWAFYVNDEYAQLGLDETEIADGAVYKLVVEKAS